MHKKKKGSGTPENPPHAVQRARPGNPDKRAFTRGIWEAKTHARFPTPKTDTKDQPSVVIEEKSVSVDDLKYPFPIEVNEFYTLKVTGLLGKGGMGVVFKAVQQFNDGEGEIKAVKIIHLDPSVVGSDPDGTKRKQLIESLIKEVRLVSKLKKNSHIIDIEVIGPTISPLDGKKVPYYVMEYVEGMDMQAVFKAEHTFTWQRLAPLMVQVCSALAEAHRHNITHLDMKPENVLLSRDENGSESIKLLDFGIAQITAPHQKSKGADKIFGSPPYMAPEQGLQKPTDNRTDIYSTGAMMYHLLTGTAPFSTEGNVFDFLMRLTSETPLPLRQINPDIPHEVEAIVLKCLDKNPNKRYQSAEELMNAIEKTMQPADSERTAIIEVGPDQGCGPDFNGGVTLPPLQDDATEIVQMPQEEKKPKRLRRILLSAAATLIIAGTAASLFMLNGTKTDKPKDPTGRHVVSAESSRASSPKEPIIEHIQDSRSSPDQEPEPTSKFISIDLRLNASGVRVMVDGKRECQDGKESCSFAVAQGSDTVKIELSKDGFENQTYSFLPDSNKEIVINMAPENIVKEKPRRMRRKPKAKKSKILIISE